MLQFPYSPMMQQLLHPTFSGWIHEKHDPSERSMFWHAFFTLRFAMEIQGQCLGACCPKSSWNPPVVPRNSSKIPRKVSLITITGTSFMGALVAVTAVTSSIISRSSLVSNWGNFGNSQGYQKLIRWEVITETWTGTAPFLVQVHVCWTSALRFVGNMSWFHQCQSNHLVAIESANSNLHLFSVV